MDLYVLQKARTYNHTLLTSAAQLVSVRRDASRDDWLLVAAVPGKGELWFMIDLLHVLMDGSGAKWAEGN